MRTLFPLLALVSIALALVVVAYVWRIVHAAAEDFKYQFAEGPKNDWRHGLNRLIYNAAWRHAEVMVADAAARERLSAARQARRQKR